MFIYKATNKRNGKVYIGKTKHFERRINEHISYSKRTKKNVHFSNALKKSPTDFYWEIIEECKNDVVNDRETHWIEHYKANNPEFGYNSTSGGDGGNINGNHPNKNEIYQKVSASLSGRKRDKNLYEMLIAKYGKNLGETKWREYRRSMGQRVSSSVLGKPKSSSHIANFSKKLKGVPQSDVAKQRKTKEGRIVPPHVVEEIKRLYISGESINFIRHSVGYSHAKVKKTLKENGLI
jgi:group I intron endonuclease